jgi:6-phosphofructokinase 1
MNACVRAVVRAAISAGHEVVGINRGYEGLVREDFYSEQPGKITMDLRTVSGWVKRGGAFLRSSRSEAFRTIEGMRTAAANLQKHGIDAIIPIGGDGTLRGAVEFTQFWQGQIVGAPGTIDNDLCGTDCTIGFSTAVNTAVEAVDKIRDTAESHDRMFLIEVMGRHSGYIAVMTALASGAEVAAIPETKTDFPKIIDYLNLLKQRGKTSLMMIVSEGDEEGGAEILNRQLIKHGCPFSTRVVILGHLQRGGDPTPEDRIRATQIGAGAVAAILRQETGVMVGVVQDQCVSTRLEETYAKHREIPDRMLHLMDAMAS